MSGCSASTDGTHAAAACCSTPSCDRQSRASPSPTGRCARPDGPDRRRNRHAEHGSYRPAWTWDDPNCLGVFEVLRREVMSGGIKMETPFHSILDADNMDTQEPVFVHADRVMGATKRPDQSRQFVQAADTATTATTSPANVEVTPRGLFRLIERELSGAPT